MNRRPRQALISATWTDGHEQGSAIHYFEHGFGDRSTVELEAKLKTIVQAWLDSPDGREYRREHDLYDFNWGDAFNEIPAAFWLEHDVRWLDLPHTARLSVDHDQDLRTLEQSIEEFG